MQWVANGIPYGLDHGNNLASNRHFVVHVAISSGETIGPQE
jgi:hypothetical protein